MWSWPEVNSWTKRRLGIRLIDGGEKEKVRKEVALR